MNLFKSADITKKYEIREMLGSGSFAEVRLGINKESGQRVAIKIIEPSDKEELEMIKSEIEILEKLDHPNIIRLIDVFQPPGKVAKGKKLYIVTELVTGGELLDRILEKKVYLESEARPIVKALLETIQYMHSQSVVHRDLKPGNILFATQAKDSPIKVVDFGCASTVTTGMTQIVGTPAFVAPEIISQRAPYGKEVDMWSVGVLSYILLSGCPPFSHEEDEKLFRMIIDGDFSFPSPHFDSVSAEAMDFCRRCLNTDPATRMTPDQALLHDWLRRERDPADLYRERVHLMHQHMLQRKFRRLTTCLIAVNKFQIVSRPRSRYSQ